LLSARVIDIVGKFTAGVTFISVNLWKGVVDTGGEFAAGVNDTGGIDLPFMTTTQISSRILV
jgi:hypothetical protein